MDLVQLKYFMKVVELRSFTKAADALHIAQPAVTRQVRMLEEELGVRLLHRHSRGTEPTEAGVRLCEGAQALLHLATETRANVVATATEAIGTLRVGFPPSVGASLVAATAANFRAAFPRVTLRLQEGYSAHLRDALLADKLDLAVLTYQQSNPLIDLSPLYDERLWLFFSNADAVRRPRIFPIDHLRDLPLIQPSPENTLRKTLDELARQAGFELNVAVESESLAVIKSLVRAGIGAHVSPFTSLADELAHDGIDGRPLGDLWISRRIARRIDRPQTLAQRKFGEALRKEVTNLAGRARSMVRIKAMN